MKNYKRVNHYLRASFIALLLIAITNTLQAQNKTGFLFFASNNELDTYFIESEDSVISLNVFKNKSYRLFDKLCTRSPRLEFFMNSKIGTRLKFDQFIFKNDTVENLELNFIFCHLKTKEFHSPIKIKPRIVAILKGSNVEIINQNFNNQIEYIFPFKKKEVEIFMAEMDKYYERFKEKE